MKRVGALALVLALAACGGPRRAESPPSDLVTAVGGEDDYRQVAVEEAPPPSAGSGATATEAMPVRPAPPEPSAAEPDYEREELAGEDGGGGGERAYDADRDEELRAAAEPGPLRVLGYVVEPSAERRAMLAMLDLPPGHAFHPPSSTCQDVLVLVREGAVEATGTGIAPPGAAATLYVGDAVRFGPEGDGLVVNPPGSEQPVRTLVAVVRRATTGDATWRPDWDDRTTCPGPTPSSDPRVRGLRMASASTAPPLVVGGGHLEVRILLDADAVGATHGGLAILAGDAESAVPEHVHEESAEVLWIEDGSGTMTMGGREIHVEPGIALYIPPATPHAFRSDGRRPLRAIQVYTPSGPEQRFRASR